MLQARPSPALGMLWQAVMLHRSGHSFKSVHAGQLTGRWCCRSCRDLAMPKFQWDAPMLPSGAAVPFSSNEIERCVSVAADPYQARRHCSIHAAPAMKVPTRHCHYCILALVMFPRIICHAQSVRSSLMTATLS